MNNAADNKPATPVKRRRKAGIINASPEFPGISSEDISTASQKSDKLLNSGDDSIQLPIANGITAKFVLHTIPWQQIEQQTTVLEANQRDQELLNETSLSDILPTIKDHGQLTPAIGMKGRGDTIVILEGTRRRASCLLAQKDYMVYVTDAEVTPSQASNISQIGNKHRQLSLYEMGKSFEQMITSNQYAHGKALGESQGVDPSTVSIARKAWSLPRALIKLFPSVNAIGKPTINKLSKITDTLKEKELSELIDQLATITIDELKTASISATEKALNAAMMTHIETQANSVSKRPTAKKTVRMALADGGSLLCAESKNKVTYTFSDLNQQQKDRIAVLLKELESGVG